VGGFLVHAVVSEDRLADAVRLANDRRSYWLRRSRSQSITARGSSGSADGARAGALLGADGVCGSSRRSALGVTGAIA
jgi:hypothetical protein